MQKIMKMVPRIVFGSGKFSELNEIISQIFNVNDGYVVFLIDSVHQKTGLRDRLKPRKNDLIIDVDISLHEPETAQIDKIRDEILAKKENKLPALLVGIGGGSTMDTAKAVSIILTNKGSSADYQGWDLPKERAVLKMGVPTISGTGSEATRTAVLTSLVKKQGINSDQSIFDAVLMDPDLIKTVDAQQEFYTAMDCFIHCVESLRGTFINEFGSAFAAPAKKDVEDFFLKEKNYGKLMMAAFFGGCSVASSEVGICHALSYGISLVFGYRHGMANSIVFNQLEEFYPEDVKLFRRMMEKHSIKLPECVTKNATEEMMNKMIEMTLLMDKPLANALGENWKNILTRDKIIELYKKM
jgi:3-deoxy-alpha-D-manno-octulosonate 8-oxidase